MANEHLQKYFRMSKEVTAIFDDLDNYLDFCRFELLPFNEADLYNVRAGFKVRNVFIINSHDSLFLVST